MKTNGGIIHQIATCINCGKQWQDYINQRARKSAYQHAITTGHTVTVETGTFITYNS
jgi:hypothetical protein